MKDNMKINFTGKEYLEYLKYEDNKPKFKFKKDTKIALFILSSFIIMAITIVIVVNMLTYTPSEGLNYTWKGIAMFCAICASIGWVIHGTGFLLVRSS